MTEVLFVDDDPAMRESVEQFLPLSGFKLRSVASAAEALTRLSQDFAGVVVTDLKMPGMSGRQLMQRVQAIDDTIPVVIITGHGDVETAVDAMRQGAYDFLEKPFDPVRFTEALSRAAEKRRLVLENRALKRSAAAGSLSHRILGRSKQIAELRESLAEIAATDISVMLIGETGAGKDLVARAIHETSRRAEGRFVAINCAAIPEAMIESELFGHEQGAFTGALKPRVGKIEYADGGTLFLDEIESMPLPMQAKLLRALQEREIERLGSNAVVSVDLRIIAAAKSDLTAARSAGTFREDLFYRLAVVELPVPPLRERMDDIPLLFEHFALRAAEANDREPRLLDDATVAALLAHDWPGNVRELRNAAERFALGFSRSVRSMDASVQDARRGSLAHRLEAFEKGIILRSLAEANGRIADVMTELDIPRRTLNDKMARHGISRPSPETDRQ